MFERYTEHARRVVFFARYEASTYGSPCIESEHLLLGFLREDHECRRFAPRLDTNAARKQIDEQTPKRPATSTSVDLPLSRECIRILKFALEESERLANNHVRTEHLLLGMLDEKNSLAAKLLCDGGADAADIRKQLSRGSEASKPFSFQRASYKDLGFRLLSAETIEIHGARWNVDYVRDAVELCRAYNWQWHKTAWKPHDIVISRTDGTCSFDLALAVDRDNFTLVPRGWKKDHCVICRWELSESNDEHGLGYTNGRDWLCTECYERFVSQRDFFSSSHSDIT